MKRTPIRSVSSLPGSVSITKYVSKNLEIPLITHLKTSRPGGSCCILTATNEEAFRVVGLLKRDGIPAIVTESISKTIPAINCVEGFNPADYVRVNTE